MRIQATSLPLSLQFAKFTLLNTVKLCVVTLPGKEVGRAYPLRKGVNLKPVLLCLGFQNKRLLSWLCIFFFRSLSMTDFLFTFRNTHTQEFIRSVHIQTHNTTLLLYAHITQHITTPHGSHRQHIPPRGLALLSDDLFRVHLLLGTIHALPSSSQRRGSCPA